MKDFWAHHDGVGLHSADAQLVEERRTIRWTVEEALAHEWDYKSKAHRRKLHENLIPRPYEGNLTKARVFVLMLNPGYKTDCYLEDHTDPVCRASKLDNLAQRIDLLPGLDPRLIRSGAYRYWRKVFAPIIDSAARKANVPLTEAAQMVARNVAVIQFCPYHSVSDPGRWVCKLPSSQAALHFVHSVLVPRAKQGEASVIVPRGATRWGLQDGKHVLVRQSNHRSASFTADECEEIERHWPV